MNDTYKSDLWVTRIRQKRHIFEKRDVQKRIIKETCQRGMWMRLMNETYKSDL